MVVVDIRDGETRTEWPIKSAINSLPGYLFVSGEEGFSFTSPYPSIEKRMFTGGPRAVIRGTRISVANIIGYLILGESPDDIAGDILPINSIQLFEAVQYYGEHKYEILKEIEENTIELAEKSKML
jgi:uncharacterized protein (DUF433 family)